MTSLAAGSGQVYVQYGPVNAPLLQGQYVFQVGTDPRGTGLGLIGSQPEVDLNWPSVDCNFGSGAAAGVGGAEGAKGLGAGAALVVPNPVRRGERLCLELGSRVKSGEWKVMDVSGAVVKEAGFGGGVEECLEMNLAPGIYVLRADLSYEGGKDRIVIRKLAVLP
jgi:hypothetical protein